MEEIQFEILRDLAIVVFSATIAIRVFSFFKLPLLLGFILVGILLSPVFGIIKNTSGIAACGDLGVMFMMFFVGLEFNLDRLKKVFAPSILGLLFQIASMVLFSLAAAKMMGWNPLNGFFLGALLSMSSTIVIIELFSQRRELNKRFAQITVGILIAEDLFAVFLLVALSSLASEGRADLSALLQTTLTMLTFVITVFVVGKLSIPVIVRKFFATNNQQELIMFTFCIIMGVGFIANWADMSLALGAFLAGSIFSGTVVSSRIQKLTDPFRNLFVALFFVSIGTMISPMEIANSWQPILFITLGIFFIRTTACFFGIALSGAKASDAFLAAVSKAQIGEFSFVVAGLGIKLGVMNQSIMAIAMGVSLLTIAISPSISLRADSIMNFFSARISSKIKIGFEVYHKFVESLAEGAKKGFFGTLIAPLTRVCVYTLLFNGLMIVTGIAQGFLVKSYSQYVSASVIRPSIWVVAAAVSFPIVWGISHNVRQCTRLIVSSASFGQTLDASARSGARRLLHGVFSTLVAVFFAAIYFSFIWHNLNNIDTFVIFVVACAVFPFFIRKYFGNMGEELESEFKTVFKRHIQNADEYRHNVMMENIRKNYEWAIDISEIEISDIATSAGKSVAELSIRKNTGAEIVAIRRGKFVSYNIMPDTRIFPDDVVVVSGTQKETSDARKLLTDEALDIDSTSITFQQNQIAINCVTVGKDSELVGKTLYEANLTNIWGIKVLGILRDMGKTHIRPSAKEKFMENDTILIMGLSKNLQNIEEKLSLFKSN